MSNTNQPAEPPPAYEAAPSPSNHGAPSAHPAQPQGPPPGQAAAPAASTSTSNSTSSSTSTGAGRQPHRQSSRDTEVDIEQEDRPLPPGWVPQFNEEHDRFFFVDTNSHPPRSTWVHPLDDEDWLSTVPRGMDPMAYLEQLWNEQPMPTPEPARSNLPAQQGRSSSYQQGGMSDNYPGPAGLQQQIMQQDNLPGRPGPNGKRLVTLEDLTQIYLQKMGTPEEYERKNPPNKASKLFHKKESASQRQRRHAEHKARDAAEALSYRSPMYPPTMYGPGAGMYAARPYGYPGYGRGYGARYPGMGMSGAFLGLGAGALLGGALF